VSWYPAVLLSSLIFVAMWGHFLYQGVIDPLGGINSLWPLFGIANQLLAAVALCVGTTIIIKMGKRKYAFVTMLPLVWLVVVTMSAAYQKIFSPDPRLGFLSHARQFADIVAQGQIPPAVRSAADASRMIWNDRLNAAVAAFFAVAVLVILADSAREWFSILKGRKPAVSTEVPFQARVAVAGD
jgi:carbon starvation protein